MSDNKKYNIKDLVKNTDFEAQREDDILSKWQGKEEPKFSESPLPKEYIEWLSKQKGVDNRGVKGEGFFDEEEIEFLESQKRDKHCENLKSKFWGEEVTPNHPENIEDCILQKDEVVKDDMDYAYFDLERMKEAMSQESIRMPKFNNVEELSEWLNRDEEDE